MVSGKTVPFDEQPVLAEDDGEYLETAAQHLMDGIKAEPVPARLQFLVKQLGVALERHQALRKNPE